MAEWASLLYERGCETTLTADLWQPHVDARLHPVRAAGKFFEAGGHKWMLRGVTYGPFSPDASGCEYHTPEAARRDFAAISSAGFNALRVYTAPPPWLLDVAGEAGLRVLVGLPWEQHVAFLGRRRARDIMQRVRAGVAESAGHPAVLGYAVGNEIPAPIVRWYGHRRIEQHLRSLYDAAKSLAPDALVTYVNYPSTEYLELPFLDFTAFNVYLESEQSHASYIARLHNIAGDRPLLIAELGLDAHRNGEQAQADALHWQTRSVLRGGCAGLFVFSWTDEWHRGGEEILDWGFGLTTRDRTPRPSLAAVGAAFQSEQAPRDDAPGVSVVVCTYNGSATLAQALQGLARLNYPNYEVIVVDDGSTDGAADIARKFDVRLIRTENRGLSSARNTGLAAARHEIVAYIDDDAWPDPDWLKHLVATFESGDHAGVGGPNIPPPDAGIVADAVAASPGGPVHVLLTDNVAEHIPGCNMAFRKSRLKEIGGFDSQFRIAGDDVDVCWRLQDRGWTLGFNPAAMVWHRRRGSVRTYWRQQLNYGRAEADLERKWPHKYNAAGHLTWSGRLYSNGLLRVMGWWRRRIYHGVWGSALFQSVYHAPPSWLWSIPSMPEWYMLAAVLAIGVVIGFFWVPPALSLPLLVLVVGATLIHSVAGARRNLSAANAHGRGRIERLKLFGLTSLLHLIQPAARLWGRLGRGLTPWRLRGAAGWALPAPRIITTWSQNKWQGPDERLNALKTWLTDRGAVVACGGQFDRWDFEVRGGVLGSARISLLAEEHGQGRQLIRCRTWPDYSAWAMAGIVILAALAVVAIVGGHWPAAIAAAVPAVLMSLRALFEAGTASASLRRAIEAHREDVAQPAPADAAPAPLPRARRVPPQEWADEEEHLQALGMEGHRP